MTTSTDGARSFLTALLHDLAEGRRVAVNGDVVHPALETCLTEILAPCSCPDRLAAGTPYLARDGWYMLAHVAREYAEKVGETPCVDEQGDGGAINVPVVACPFCGCRLKEGKP
jgi:hypothetical protein